MLGGVENSFSETIVGLDSKTFSLSNLTTGCECEDNQRQVKCDFTISYTQNGIEKTISVIKTIECVTKSTSSSPDQVVGLGVGTLEDPWIINSCLELQDMNEHLDGNYALGGDINCIDTMNWNNGLGFNPIGDNANRFSGSLNGRNHIIYLLKINRPLENEVGLFGHTSSASSIKNLGLISQNIIGNYELGSIAGINRGLIQNVYVTGTIRSNTSSSYYMRLGGLAGAHVSPGLILNCYNTGDVIGFEGRHVGGLIGYNQLGTVSNSFTTGNVSGEAYIGGLIGNNYYGGIVTNSYSTGNITGRYIVGGLIGYNHDPSIVSNSYAIGNAGNGSGMADIGGLIGMNHGSISTSFSTGVSSGAEGRIGGLIGTNTGSISTSYFDKTGTKTDSMCGSTGGTGCDDSKGIDISVQVNYFYLSSNVPLSSWTFGTDGNWVARDNNYPILSWQ